MATVLDDNPYAVRKTQAMPKHSLFGTSLEIYNEEEKQQIMNTDDDIFKLPDEKKPQKKNRSKGEELAALARRQYEERKKATESARNKFKSLEQDAILMCTGVRGSLEVAAKMEEISNRISPKDIEYSEEINFGCMPDGRRSYNRDKYGRPPPFYRNLATRSALSSREQALVPHEGILHPNPPRIHRNRALREVTDYHDPIEPPACIPIPPNIRHRFGSKVVDSLLSDEEKVLATIEKKKLALKLPAKSYAKETAINLGLDTNSDYSTMGNMIRQNVFPGYSMRNAQSYSKSVYNDEVYLHRVPDTDEYRYQRDHLSTWAEHNVLRDRMKKAWNAKMAEKGDKQVVR